MAQPLLLESFTLPSTHHKHRILIRMPNWLGDVVMALPVVRALNAQLSNTADITLLAQAHFIPLINQFEPELTCAALPKKSWRYYWSLRSLRAQQFDCHILFTQSERGDLEARIIGAKHRIGMSGRRFALTKHYQLPSDKPFKHTHQTHIWALFLEYFGLTQAANVKPYELETKQKTTSKKTIGLICGTENYPAKRWPINHWSALIEQLIQHEDIESIKLFGTQNDCAITDVIEKNSNSSTVHNLAGKTNIVEFMREMAECDAMIGNDTGGMHLANAIGVTSIVLFGPTNPVNTGPIYDAAHTVLQPPNCPPTGGKSIDSITPNHVIQTLEKLLN